MSDMEIKVILEEANVNKDFFTSNHKENNLKCPFCQQELVIPKEEIRNGIQCCVCRNPKCEFDGWHFPVKLVQKLITTRKALDVAVDGLEEMTWGCDSSDAEHLLKEIKKITALDQKE